MMRPPGDVRLALRAAAVDLYHRQGACHRHDLAQAAQVGRNLCQRTVENMARSGELLRVGHASRPGGGWIALYEPAPALLGDQVFTPPPGEPSDARFAPLAFVLGQWPRGGG